MVVKVISFCDGFSNSSELVARFETQVKECEFIDEVRVFNLKSLPIEVKTKKNLGKFIALNSRGFGYWIWKPYLLLEVALEAKFGDVLAYCDVGCELSKAGGSQFQQYVKNAQKNGITCFYTGNGDPEYVWTKAELIKLLELPDYKIQEEQISATFFLIVVSQKTIAFLKEWINISNRDSHLYINDKIVMQQNKRFKEHRHDQSIFSLLNKKYDISPINDRTEYPRQFYYKNSYIYKYPIHTIRNKTNKKIITVDQNINFNFISKIKFKTSFFIYRLINRLKFK